MQGGEAIFDKKRLDFILNNCHIDESYVTIVSNGYYMNKETIKYLKNKGVDKISLSLDSFDETIHDSGRMQGSYKKVMQAIDDILESGLLCAVSTVVTHNDGGGLSQDYKNIVDFAVKKGIRIDTQIAMPVGEWDGQTENLITKEDAKDIKNFSLITGKMPNGQYYITRDLYTTKGDFCPAAVSFMSLTADGEILPCNFLQFSLGNIKDTSIKDARDKIMKSPWFSGKSKLCLCGEDKKFINEYIVKNKEKIKPLNAYELFFKEK